MPTSSSQGAPCLHKNGPGDQVMEA